jgi:hypothetical protein
MKHIIFILFLLSVLFGVVGCLKEDTKSQRDTNSPLINHKYFTIESVDFSGIRDGGRRPFHFVTSQVTYDPFTKGYPQEATNIQKLDSVTYVRVEATNAGAFDTSFDIYNITQYFKDGSTKSATVYGETKLGDKYTYLPDTDFNQLSVNNPYNFVTLKRGTRAETYTDNVCGKVKKRFTYIHYFNQDSVGVNSIDGDRCISNVFSYQLITF